MPKGTFIQVGATIDFLNSGAEPIGYNDLIVLPSRIAIAGENIPVGSKGSLHVVGVYELPAVNDAAFSVGDTLHWDATAGKLTKTATNNTLAGWCTEPKLLAGTSARVKIG